MKIGMILDRDFPPDDRPEKEALSLIKAGHEVYLLCYTATGKPLIENYKGIKITRFPLSEKVHKKLSAAYLVLPFYRWIWTKQMNQFIKDNRLDILHIHDLPMTDIAHKFARRYKLKVVCDQHEYWSNWIGHTAHYNTPIGKFVRALSDWKRYERVNLQKGDLVITVEEPLKKAYIEEVGLAPEKIITVPNTPSKKIFNGQNIDPETVKKYAESFVIFYAGALDVLRGLDVVIQALPDLMKEIPEVKVVLAGRVAKNCNPMEDAAKLGVSKSVDFLGWLPVEKIPSYIAASKICINTPPAQRYEINNTIGTKMYQYAAMRKPIITSEARMMKEFVESNEIGYSVPYNDRQGFVKIVIELYKNYQQESQRIKENCERLSQKGDLFWEDRIENFVNNYSTLMICNHLRKNC